MFDDVTELERGILSIEALDYRYLVFLLSIEYGPVKIFILCFLQKVLA